MWIFSLGSNAKRRLRFDGNNESNLPSVYSTTVSPWVWPYYGSAVAEGLHDCS